MSDDRLFSSNNAIRRKWYFLNLLFLAIIIVVVCVVFTSYVIPKALTEDYYIISTWVYYFILFSLTITFFSLIDRRLYDISGSRDKGLYKQLEPIFVFSILVNIFIWCWEGFHWDINLPFPLFKTIANILLGVFVVLTIAIGFIKGKKTKA